MNCREALEHFGYHVDGELGTVARWRLRLHLWVCRHCRRYLRSYKLTVRAEKIAFDQNSEEPAKLPEEQVASILAAVSNARSANDMHHHGP